MHRNIFFLTDDRLKKLKLDYNDENYSDDNSDNTTPLTIALQ
jgi:hypothetical protein